MTPQDAVERIAKAYREGYWKQKAVAMNLLDQYESLEGRDSLAKTDPELAKQFEGHTRAEREQVVEQLAVSVGVAHAIFEAFRI